MPSQPPPVYGPPWARRGAPPPALRWVPVVLCIVLQLPALGIALVHQVQPIAVALVLLVIVASLALPWRRRAPGPLLVAVTALCCPAIAFEFGPPTAAIPVAFALVTAVFHGKKVWAWATIAGLAVTGGAALYAVTMQPVAVVRLVLVTLALCLVAAITEGARSRRDRYRAAAREAGARRQSAAEAERLRIARELHDILAHSLSEISVQAGVGLHLFDSRPEQARAALASIRQTSGTALDEVRGVLGLLRADGEAADRLPEPTLSRLGELVDAAARRGVIVTLDDRIPADSGASASVQATIYRIVQEALTNVAKHAGVMTATVVIDGDPDTFRVQVDNPAAAPAPGGTGATGWDEPADDPHVRRGLLGMRERVQLLGGSLSAGPTAEGGWRVAARIPRQRHADADGASDERGTT